MHLCVRVSVCVCVWQGRGLAHFYLLTAVGVAQSAAPMPENLCTNCVAYFLVLAERLQVRAALSAVSKRQRGREGKGAKQSVSE